jgi:hypothetical protein
MSSEPFISNDLFLLYSDIVLDKLYSWDVLKTWVGLPKKYVILVKTEYVDAYIPWLLSFPYPYVLLTTCNNDYCMPYESFPPHVQKKKLHDSLLACANMTCWMTKNPSIRHPKVTGLPLGPKWQYQSYDFFGEDKQRILKILHRHCMTPLVLFESEKPNFMYVNFDVTTTKLPFYKPHTNMRELLLNRCMQEGFEVSPSCEYEVYLQDLKTYKFCMAPPGRGIDTHRVWESLMVGTIPVVVTSPLDSLYEELPVVIIKNVSQISKEYLEKEYLNLKKRKYTFEQLYAPYWKKRTYSDYESQSLVC